MAIGAIWAPKPKVREANKRIRELKVRNGLSVDYELKWSKISPNHCQVYEDVVSYFFDDDDLHYRSVLIDSKDRLDHQKFGQTHDDWYFKMHFILLKFLIMPQVCNHIYLDHKDTRSAQSTRKLRDVLCNNIYDFERSVIRSIQIVRSDEIQLVQLADILTGAMTYANRTTQLNKGKNKVLSMIRAKSGYTLTSTTLYREDKLNIFSWKSM